MPCEHYPMAGMGAATTVQKPISRTPASKSAYYPTLIPTIGKASASSSAPMAKVTPGVATAVEAETVPMSAVKAVDVATLRMYLRKRYPISVFNSINWHATPVRVPAARYRNYLNAKARVLRTLKNSITLADIAKKIQQQEGVSFAVAQQRALGKVGLFRSWCEGCDKDFWAALNTFASSASTVYPNHIPALTFHYWDIRQAARNGNGSRSAPAPVGSIGLGAIEVGAVQRHAEQRRDAEKRRSQEVRDLRARHDAERKALETAPPEVRAEARARRGRERTDMFARHEAERTAENAIRKTDVETAGGSKRSTAIGVVGPIYDVAAEKNVVSCPVGTARMEVFGYIEPTTPSTAQEVAQDAATSARFLVRGEEVHRRIMEGERKPEDPIYDAEKDPEKAEEAVLRASVKEEEVEDIKEKLDSKKDELDAKKDEVSAGAASPEDLERLKKEVDELTAALAAAQKEHLEAARLAAEKNQEQVYRMEEEINRLRRMLAAGAVPQDQVSEVQETIRDMEQDVAIAAEDVLDAETDASEILQDINFTNQEAAATAQEIEPERTWCQQNWWWLLLLALGLAGGGYWYYRRRQQELPSSPSGLEANMEDY